jgi:hypothetical protein
LVPGLRRGPEDAHLGVSMKKLVPAAAFTAVLALSAFAYHRPLVQELCAGFLPENDMKIPVGDVRARGIDEAMFNSVLDRVERVYTPIVAAKGGQLRVVRKWADPTVNAYAQQMGNVWQITMFGGLARHAATTEEGFMLVACHELGHHIGGHPKSSWATNEGGSDYYATLKCMRIMYGENAPLGEVDPVAEAGCSSQFPDAGRNGCRNGVRGGQSVAFLFQALRNSPTPPKFDTPNQTVVDRMYNAHPETQCRLDTYYQGALCAAALGTDVGADPNAGTCTAKNGHSVGLRPRCWYKPSPTESAAPAEEAVAGRPLGLDEKSISSKLESMRAVLSGRGI